MINKSSKQKLKRIIGNEYANDVLGILNAKGIVNRLGNPHNAHYVRAVFTGQKNNQDVEDAIYEYAKQQIKLAADRKEARETILNKKPVAATTG